jgi:cytokinin dehydrogenase
VNSIASDLSSLISGKASSATAALNSVSTDFGGMVTKQPLAVVSPASTQDVAATVAYAAAHQLTVSSRAAGHSLNGQALSEGGILLDMRSLNQLHQVDEKKSHFLADAGTTWQQIVDAVIPLGLTPPVLTNNFEVSIGGTHSSAGLGPTSFRHGSQSDNCLALEVVTAAGDILWCSPEQNSELFNHVLCGHGQFGIITQIKHQLRKYKTSARTYFLCYDELDALLQDQRFLVNSGYADALLTVFAPCLVGFSRAGSLPKPIVQWFYRIQATIEADTPGEIDESFLTNLHFYRHSHTEDLSFAQHIRPMGTMPHPVNAANPWLDIMLPATAAQAFFTTALERVPSFIDFRTTPIGSFSLLAKNVSRPMLSLPDEDIIFSFGMYPTVPKAQFPQALAQLNQLSDLGFKMGGKRYLVSWIDFAHAQWQQQFGDYWPRVNRMKQKYDPNHLLNPGFIQYDEPVSAISPSKTQASIAA